MNVLLEKIRSRGHWKVVIRPGTFVANRVPNITELYPILESRSVQLRGWDFPHLDSKTRPQIDQDWIEQASEWEQYLEFWRFYQTGQFVDFSGFTQDWRDQSRLSPPDKDWKPKMYLSVERAVFRFTEIFEFAARLSLTEAGDEQMHLEIIVGGLNGRGLGVDPVRRAGSEILMGMKATIEEKPYKIDLSRVELITEPRGLALKPAVELFRRFGWDPSLEILRDMQDELLHRGSGVVGRSP